MFLYLQRNILTRQVCCHLKKRFYSEKKKQQYLIDKKNRRKLFVQPKPREEVSPPISKMASCVQQGSISLTRNEESLFSMLRVVVTDMHLGTTIRVAGGWVRDKLLYGVTKDDVDLCIDNMTGEQFCYHMNEWAKNRGKQVYKFGVIQSNPDKSKHLATATVKINGFDVDFVNLRSETYVEHSRIPLVEFGTPLEDARRRDLTVNSLFYNIHTDEVEDFTGMGIEDIKNRLLRTPLDPFVTLIDDPLRAFRVLRFACRLDFKIADTALAACGSPEVIASLSAKVSRERILKEVEGTLTGSPAQATRAVFLLHRLGLLRCMLFASHPDDTYPDVVLADGKTELMTGEAFSTARSRGCALLMLMECVGYLLGGALSEYNCLASYYACIVADRDTLVKDKLTRRFAALTHPFDSITVLNPLKPTRQISLSDHILLNEIKVPSKVATICGDIQRGAKTFMQLLRDADASILPDRSKLGEAIKDSGPLYREILFMATTDLLLDLLLSVSTPSGDAGIDSVINATAEQLQVIEAIGGGYFGRKIESEEQLGDFDTNRILKSLHSDSCRRVFSCAEQLIRCIEFMELHEIWLQPPLIRGNDLKKLLPSVPAGPVYAEILREEFRFRMLNPTADAAAVAAHLQEVYHQFR